MRSSSRGRPERVVEVRAVGPLFGWRAPDHRPLEAHLGAAFELAGAGLGVVERDHRQPGHVLLVVADVFGEPVVVGAEAIGLQPGILEPEDAEAQGRVEDVGLDAVERVVLLPLGWVPAAGPGVGIGGLGQELGQFLGALAGGEPDPDRMRGIALIEEIGAFEAGRVDHQPRRPLAILLVDPRGPQIRGFANMRIRGDQPVIRHLHPPSETCRNCRGPAPDMALSIGYDRGASAAASRLRPLAERQRSAVLMGGASMSWADLAKGI